MRRKRPNRLRPIAGLFFLFSAGLLIFSSCTESPVKATVGPDGVQTVQVIVQHGYKPSHIEAEVGKPLRIEFLRKEDPNAHSCGEDLLIPSENISLHLPANESQIVEINPQLPGEITFECGMKMMKGKITFK
ncbi:MAG TPA: cupredoxin domain-containing protein [Oculatellaceae cyanobacterium]|jgi:plastocyanin domain-containing protein